MAEGAQARKLAVECKGNDDVCFAVYTVFNSGRGSDGVGGNGGIALSNGDRAGEAVGEDGYDVAESGWRLVVDLNGGGSRAAELAPWFPLVESGIGEFESVGEGIDFKAPCSEQFCVLVLGLFPLEVGSDSV